MGLVCRGLTHCNICGRPLEMNEWGICDKCYKKEEIRRNKDIRIIGFRRSNKGRNSDVYMIRECENCNAIIEFPSNQVSTKAGRGFYKEYIICPNCNKEVIVLEHKSNKRGR